MSWRSKRKPKGPTARARARKSSRLRAEERQHKTTARERDGNRCRFPLCGCKRNPGRHFGLKTMLTVSHDKHKGMGGDPTGEASTPDVLLSLCKWRHQDAPVSRHAGTMRTKYLSADNCDGPLAFEVDLHAVYPGLYERSGVWFEVAREHYVEGGSGELRLKALTAEQQTVLDDLAEMER